MTNFLPPASRKFVCSISGIEEEGDSFYETEEKDGLFDLPLGWTAVAIKRRVSNPKYQLLMQMREVLVANMLTQAGKNVSPAQAAAIELQVEAQFAALLKDTPAHVTEHEVAFIAPVERSDEMLLEVYNELRTTLGLPLLSADGSLGDDEDGDEGDSGEQNQASSSGGTTSQASLTSARPADQSANPSNATEDDEDAEDPDSEDSLVEL